MTNPQQPGNWNDPSWPSGQPASHPDPAHQVSGQPAGYPDPAHQVSGQPAGYPDPTYQQAYPDVAKSPYQDPYQPTSGQPASGYPAPGPGQPGPGGYPAGGYPSYGYPVAVAPPTNGMAIASMIVSIVAIVGLCGYGLGGYIGIVGALLGHSARKKIRQSGENGDSMALAGVIMGWIATAIAVLATIAIVVLIVIAINSDSTTSTY